LLFCFLSEEIKKRRPQKEKRKRWKLPRFSRKFYFLQNSKQHEKETVLVKHFILKNLINFIQALALQGQKNYQHVI